MTVFYPVSLKLDGRRCVVIGGGPVAEQKVMGLLAAGARVTVISPETTGRVAGLAARGAIQLIQRRYLRGDLEGAFLAVTDDRSVNHEVWEEAEERGVLLNAVDDLPHCGFIAPAIYRQGDLTVAVSTAGKSPALAAHVRDRLGAPIGPEYGTFLDLLGELRPQVALRVPDAASRAALWRRIVDSDAIEFIRRGNLASARGRITHLVDEAAAGSGARSSAGIAVQPAPADPGGWPPS
ncbi:MAG TPA: bifunctional precorrin-2 dehydrogenase/sirohydrochlorin ferrochelatase [bacterium]|nr:bifunctional precorrin-2 dehydrogenase/sirohydrochlorin ferrochelatase [bacterium]